jgi:Ca2+-binding EF-hand superfamily protein
LRFINSYFYDQGWPPVTNLYFNRLFAEFDVNKDGHISKKEMFRFVISFMSPKCTQDEIINELVGKIFAKYDTDRSGALNRRESLKVVNDVYTSEGRRPVSNTQFTKIFKEFDVNGDGVLSKREMQ